MQLTQAILGLTILSAAPAAAELPVPAEAAATQNAQAYLFHGGAGDAFEITSSMIALKNSQNADVRAFATMLIADHTKLTNTTLASAKAAGLMPPPPILTRQQMDGIKQLTAAAANFDRFYLQQQMAAHQKALALHQGYAANGDTRPLRQNAATAAPIIQSHLQRVQQLMSRLG